MLYYTISLIGEENLLALFHHAHVYIVSSQADQLT